MKRALVFALASMLLVAAAGYAPCFYPKSRHIDYYQHHSNCVWVESVHHWACSDWWSLDGTCDIDCDGNSTCEGDTHVDSQTMTDVTLGSCPPVCE